MTTIHKNGTIEDVYDNGYIRWSKNGKNHREDGPAIIHCNGNLEYWIDGIEISEKKFNTRVLQSQLNQELSKSEIKTKQLKI
jgi:hypothetical protein